jgi:hypothetical protein
VAATLRAAEVPACRGIDNVGQSVGEGQCFSEGGPPLNTAIRMNSCAASGRQSRRRSSRQSSAPYTHDGYVEFAKVSSQPRARKRRGKTRDLGLRIYQPGIWRSEVAFRAFGVRSSENPPPPIDNKNAGATGDLYENA